MRIEQKKELERTFRAEITNRAKQVDPSSELDWHSLTVGWAIAKGFTPEESYSFATYIRYETDAG